MSVKYAVLKRAARLLNFQKIMAQPYSKLQETFKTAAATPKIPVLQDPEFTFETQTLCGQPVLYIKHKQATQKVCVYVVGGGNGALHGRKLPISLPVLPKEVRGFAVRRVSCFPQSCLKLFIFALQRADMESALQ